MITSLTNDFVKHCLKLHEKKYRQEFGEFLVEGEHLVNEAIEMGLCKKVIVETNSELFNAEIIEVTPEIMKKISGLVTTPSVIGICHMKSTFELSNRILLLDGIQDPGNLGTLVRSAVAFGYNTIVAQNTVDITNPKVLRSTQGAIFKIQFMEEALDDFIEKHPEYYIIGTDVSKGVPLSQVMISNPKVAILLGNEGNGVRKSLLELTNQNIKIEMTQMESLNVGVAGSILMYHFK